MGLADRIVLMNRGHVEQIDTPSALYQHPRTLFAADFIGHANWIEGQLSRTTVEEAIVATALGPIPVRMGQVADGPVTLCIRPERLALMPAAPSQGETRLQAVVEKLDPVGPDLRIWCRLSDGTQVQSLEKNVGRDLPAPGTKVSLGFGLSDCIVLPGRRPQP